MKRIILQHGLGGMVPWCKWLQKRSADFDVRVIAPVMPSPRKPIRDEWLAEMARTYGSVDDAIIIAHSLGGYALVHYLGKHARDQKARAVIFLAAPAIYTGKEHTEVFYNAEPDWHEAKKHAEQFIYLYSPGDPFVSADHAATYENALGAEVISVEGEGHFIGSENEVLWNLISRFI